MKTIKTLTLSTVLAAACLSAGAFANSAGTAVQVPLQVKTSVTVMHKTSQWPIIVRLKPCDLRRCINV